MVKQIFVLSLKIIPIIQMIGMLFNNICYLLNINYKINYIFDFLIGNSLISTILLYVCSYTFRFCNWHRLLITANFINISIAAVDAAIGIPISNFNLLVLYHIVASIFIILAIYNKFIYRNEKCNKYSR